LEVAGSSPVGPATKVIKPSSICLAAFAFYTFASGFLESL
jgi:hypothetical protein